ncbi:putative Cyclin-dependent kinase 16 isoform X6 protein, partial [Naja naja]
NGQNGRPSLLL